MTKIISIFNQKGGVGKTLTAINTADALQILGKKVLLIDMDPQGNATSGLGLTEFDEMIYDFLIEGSDCIYKLDDKELYIIPANSEFAGVEIELASEKNWQILLKERLKNIKDQFDYVLIDSPPSLGILSLMSLVASDSVLVPVQCEYLALEGLSQLIKTLNMVRENFNPQLKLEGLLMTMYDGRNNLSRQVDSEVREHFKDKVYQTRIVRNVRLSEAPSFGKSIFDYDRASNGAISYMKFVRELIR